MERPVKPRFIMMCGIPGSGKSKFAGTYAVDNNATVFSSDILRQELFGDENVNDKNAEVFAELHKRVKNSLSLGESVVMDATNIHHKRRKAFLDELGGVDCHKLCAIMATPYKECLRRNKERGRVVPTHVIRKMYEGFYIPQKYEGWDEIRFAWSKDGYKEYGGDSLRGLFDKLDNFDQENPNHKLTLGGHMRKCVELAQAHDFASEYDKDVVSCAAILHDIGKYYTKSFTNRKGEASEIAHYYNHHYVGAYEAMFYLRELGIEDSGILEICNYIQWHMQPYFMETEKSVGKFINLVGEDFYKNLLILHESDKAAH